MSNNIYNQFNKTLKYNLSNILKSTKDMIIDTNKFKDYSKNYYNFTQSTTFMKPEINEYPIIKNTKYIPINKKIFSLSNEGEKKIKKKKIFKRNLLLNDSKKSIIPKTHRTINSGYYCRLFVRSQRFFLYFLYVHDKIKNVCVYVFTFSVKKTRCGYGSQL